eukprot:scpid104908/ scgid12630/ 
MHADLLTWCIQLLESGNLCRDVLNMGAQWGGETRKLQKAAISIVCTVSSEARLHWVLCYLLRQFSSCIHVFPISSTRDCMPSTAPHFPACRTCFTLPPWQYGNCAALLKPVYCRDFNPCISVHQLPCCPSVAASLLPPPSAA